MKPLRLFFILLLVLPAIGAAQVTVVQSVAETSTSPTPTDNDYTRINDAIQAATMGETIQLEGTFDWTEANAAASWVLGSDGVAATGDDYIIQVPSVDGVTLTAASLGDAVIQGPGDDPAFVLEGFLYFLNNGTHPSFQDWTVSNLTILDFDLSLGFFYDSGNTTAFNNLLVDNNRIRIATDVKGNNANGTGETFQNIGIHLAFGIDQTISNNVIEIPGDGVSDPDDPMSEDEETAASVALQSNTSGGSVYDGLLIDNNEVRVLEAQDANPEFVLGIWENSHAHSANITVSNNRFLNFSPGNDPALNDQEAFRVSSHSSATTTSLYMGNVAEGAASGITYITGFGGIDLSGHEPVQLIGNTLLDNGIGILIQSMGNGVLRCNRFFGNTVAISNTGTLADADADENWFGCNDGPGMGTCDPNDATVDTPSWLVLEASSDDATLTPGMSTTVTAELTRTSAGVVASCTIPDGVPVDFVGVGGSMSPVMGSLAAGTAQSTFTAGSEDGLAVAAILIDGETVAAPIDVDASMTDLQVTKTDGIDVAAPGSTLTYTIVVTNAGPSDVIDATVTDLQPAQLTDCSWTCSSTDGGICTASGMNGILDSVDLPAGSSVTYELTCTYDPTPVWETVTNIVSVVEPVGMTDTTPSNNTAQDQTLSQIVFTDGFESGDLLMWSNAEP